MKKNNSKRYIFFVAFVSILVITSYFFIRGDFVIQDNKTIQLQNPIRLDEKPLPENIEENVKPTIILQALKENFNPPAYQGSSYHQSCGREMKHFEMKIDKTKVYSEVQLQAIEAVKTRCQQWYDFLGAKNNEELKDYQLKMRQAKELNAMFMDDSGISSKDKIATARTLVESGDFDSSMLSYDALMFLLENDDQFLQRIAEELNIKGTEYIKANTKNIIALYNCSINYATDCAPNSTFMLMLCYISSAEEQVCGKSYSQLIAEETTVNNYMDLENIVSIIRQLIKQGYFKSY